MNTIQFRGSYTRTNSFMRGGEDKLFKSNKFNLIFKKYLKYLNSINFTNSTKSHRLNFTYHFLTFLEDNHIQSLKKINKLNVYDYINLYDSYNHAISTKDRNKIDIRSFLNWAYNNNYSNFSGVMVLPRIILHKISSKISYYTKEEIQKMLDIIDRRTKKGKEDYLIISLICYYGLRISDVINLKISNIDFNENVIKLIQYKTNNKLILPLIDEVKYIIIDYLKNVRPTDANMDYIFITTTKPYKHKDSLKRQSYIVMNYFIKAGVNITGRKAGFNCLRHSFGSMLLKENVPLYSISTILGHQNTDTTFIYLNIDTSKLKKLALEVPIC